MIDKKRQPPLGPMSPFEPEENDDEEPSSSNNQYMDA